MCVKAIMFPLALLVCVGVVAVRADLAGVTVADGDCLCVTGTGVNARDSPGTSGTTVIAHYDTGSCFKLSGGIQTVGSYTWYQVTDGSKRFWIAGDYLKKSSPSDCTSGACGAREKALACELLRNPKIGLAKIHPSSNHDNAYAYNNLRDMCDGLKASRSSYSCSECAKGAPGGTVCLSVKVLEYLAALAKKYNDVYVTELAGACHSCSSLHYSGRAVDLRIPGSKAQRQGYLDTCKDMKPSLALDEGNHIHCQF